MAVGCELRGASSAVLSASVGSLERQRGLEIRRTLRMGSLFCQGRFILVAEFQSRGEERREHERKKMAVWTHAHALGWCGGGKDFGKQEPRLSCCSVSFLVVFWDGCISLRFVSPTRLHGSSSTSLTLCTISYIFECFRTYLALTNYSESQGSWIASLSLLTPLYVHPHISVSI